MLELARLLTVYCGRMMVHIIPFTEIQEEIRRQLPGGVLHPDHAAVHDAAGRGGGPEVPAPPPWSPASPWARWPARPCMALGVTEDVTTLPVLRPLIGMDKVEIIRMAREIGTYDTSILPYEDCCTVFTPRHPATRPDAGGRGEG